MTTALTHEDIAADLSRQATTGIYSEPDDIAFFAAAPHLDAETRERLLTERAIIRRAVRDLLAAGYLVGVFDGEAVALERSCWLPAIMAAIMSTDEDVLRVYETYGAGKKLGAVQLIYGNGWDVLADHAEALTDVLAGAHQLAEGLSEVGT